MIGAALAAPASAVAAEPRAAETVVTMTDGQVYDIKQNGSYLFRGTASNASIRVYQNVSANVTFSDLAITNAGDAGGSPLYIDNGATVELTLEGVSVLQGALKHANSIGGRLDMSGGAAAVYLPESAKLVIKGPGALKAVGGQANACTHGAGGGAGIGTNGSYINGGDFTAGSAAGTLEIESGTVRAIGGASTERGGGGAGIGGGGCSGASPAWASASSGGTVTVAGGLLQARGSGNASAVGGGGGFENGDQHRGTDGSVSVTAGTLEEWGQASGFATKVVAIKPNGNLITKTYDGSAAATGDLGLSFDSAFDAPPTGAKIEVASTAYNSKDVAQANRVIASGISLVDAVGCAPANTTTSVPASITPAPVGLAPSSFSKTYDKTTDADLKGASFTGIVSGEDVSVDTSSAKASFGSSKVSDNATVEVTGLSLSGSGKDNYSIASPLTVKGCSIKPATLTFSCSPLTKDYDGSPDVALEGSSLAGVFPGDIVSVDEQKAKASFASRNVVDGATVSVTDIALAGDDAANYSVADKASVDGCSIKPATLTFSCSPLTKGYDGSPDVALKGSSLTGIFPGDDVSVDEQKAKAAFDSPGVVDNANVSVTGLALTGRDAANYSVADKASVAGCSIAPRELTLSCPPLTKDYDGSAEVKLSGTSLAGIVSNDDVRVDEQKAKASFDLPGVVQDATVSVTDIALAGDDAANYSVADKASVAGCSIAPRELTFSCPPLTKDYDGSAEVKLSGTSLADIVSNDDVRVDEQKAKASFASRNVAQDATVKVSGLALAGDDAANYTMPSTASVEHCSIKPKGLSLDPSSLSKTYDKTTSVDLSRAALAGVVDGDAVAVDVSKAKGSFDGSGASDDATATVEGLALSGEGKGNYSIPSPLTVNGCSIEPKELGLDPKSLSRAYDGSTGVDLSGAELTGVFDGDVVSVDVSKAEASFDGSGASDSATVTVGGLALSGASAGNYSIPDPLTVGGCSIERAELAFSCPPLTKDYDGSPDVALEGFSLTGVFPGDAVSADLSNAKASFASRDVAQDATVEVTGLALAGKDAANYTMPSTASVEHCSIKPKELAFSCGPLTKEYDGSELVTLKGSSLKGIVSNDDVRVDEQNARARFDLPGVVQDATVEVSDLALAGDDAGNYSLEPAASVAGCSIEPKGLSLDPSSLSKTYDKTTDAGLSEAVLAGVVDGDEVSVDVSKAKGSFDASRASDSATVTVEGLALSGASAGNYSIADPLTVEGCSIEPKALDLDPAPFGRFYDGSTAANLSRAVLAGVFDGDEVAADVSKASASFDAPGASDDVAVTVTGLSLSGRAAGNYSIADPLTVNGCSIEPKELGFSCPPLSKVYDGSELVALEGFSLTGVVSGDSVSADLSNARAAFGSPDVADGATVRVSGLALAGDDAANYWLEPAASVEGCSISRAENAWASSPAVRVDGWTYGGEPSAPAAQAAFGTPSFSYADAEEGPFGDLPAKPHAGTWYAKASVAGTGNYGALESAPTAFEIAPARLAGLSAEASLTRNQPGCTTTVDLSKLLPSDAGGSPAYAVASRTDAGLTGAEVDASSGVLALEADDRDPAEGAVDVVAVAVTGMLNYEDASVEVSVGYSDKATATVDGVSPEDAEYDGAPHAGYAGFPQAGAPGVSGPVELEVGYEGTLADGGAYGPCADAPVKAGSYSVTFSVPRDHPLASGSKTLSFSISARDLELQAAERPYDGTDAFDGSLLALSREGGRGVLPGDDVSLDASSATAVADSPFAGRASVARVSGASLAGADAASYRLATSFPVSISRAENAWAAQPSVEGWTYGERPKAPAAQAAFGAAELGWVAPDGTILEALPDRPVAGTWTLAARVPGTSDYAGLEGEAAFEVLPAALVVRADDAAMTAGGELPELSYTVEGLLDGDALAVEPKLSVTGDTGAPGTCVIEASGAQASPAGCYALSHEPGTLTVAAAPAADADADAGGAGSEGGVKSLPGAPVLAPTGDPVVPAPFVALGCCLALLGCVAARARAGRIASPRRRVGR